MRTEKKTSKTNDLIWHDSFGSVSEFADWVSNTPYNNRNKKEVTNGYLLGRERIGKSWNGTSTWQEAQDLLIKGYPEGLKQMLECKDAIKITQPRKSSPQPAMVGYAPHIANAVMGLPKTMIKRPKVEQKAQTISLYYDTTIHKDIKTSVLAKGGANLMAVIKYLESKNYRVNLHMVCASSAKIKTGGHTWQHTFCSIKVKDARQALNPMLISYPVTHCAFFRRHIITYLQCAEATEHKAYKGEGCPTKGLKYTVGDMQNYLRNSGVMTQNDYYLDCEEVAKATSIDEIFNQINFKQIA